MRRGLCFEEWFFWPMGRPSVGWVLKLAKQLDLKTFLCLLSTISSPDFRLSSDRFVVLWPCAV
jgi:hypothetical protein